MMPQVTEKEVTSPLEEASNLLRETLKYHALMSHDLLQRIETFLQSQSKVCTRCGGLPDDPIHKWCGNKG